MLYHSHLLINVGDNPDRPDWNICRRWLRNLYRVHQRLCMAFPSTAPAENEREAVYCRSFRDGELPMLHELPAEADGDVHQARTDDAGFLFRIDYPVDAERGGRRPVIIVQSANEPDWRLAFGLSLEAGDDPDAIRVDDRKRPVGNAGYLLAAPPQAKEVSIDLDGDTLALGCPKQNYRIRPGDLVRFRLRANPTRKVQDGSPNGKRKRVKPTPEDHADWLARKLGAAADSPPQIYTFVPGWAYGWRTKHEPQPSQRMQALNLKIASSPRPWG